MSAEPVSDRLQRATTRTKSFCTFISLVKIEDYRFSQDTVCYKGKAYPTGLESSLFPLFEWPELCWGTTPFDVYDVPVVGHQSTDLL